MKKAKEIKSSRIADILKRTSLETRLKVSNQMAFITLLSEVGFRENKVWSDEEDELLTKLCDLALKHTKHQLEQIKEWEKDGRPKEEK